MREEALDIYQEGISDTHRRERLIQTLTDHHIDLDAFTAARPETRLGMIIDGYHLSKSPAPKLKVTPEFDDDQGLIVIKPELYDETKEVVKYLNFLGIPITQTQVKPFIFTPEQYWLIYGHTFLSHSDTIPHWPLLFLISITSPSTLITFKHLTAKQYRNFYSSLGAGLPVGVGELDNDPQATFDHLFIRHGQFSLRNIVVMEVITKKHLDNPNPKLGLRVYWDFTGTFGKRSPAENRITFNGVHSPNNAAELKHDKLILV